MRRLAALCEVVIYGKRKHAVGSIDHGLQVEAGRNLLDSLPSVEERDFSGFFISSGERAPNGITSIFRTPM